MADEQELSTWERMLGATLEGRELGQDAAPVQPSAQMPAALDFTVEQQPAALPSLPEIPEERFQNLEPISAGGVVNPFIPHPAAGDAVAFEAEATAWQLPADPDDDEMTEALGFTFEPEHGPVSELPAAALQDVRVKKVPTSPSRAAAASQPTAAVATETALPGAETREADNWPRRGTGTDILEAAAVTAAIPIPLPILTPASAAKSASGPTLAAAPSPLEDLEAGPRFDPGVALPRLHPTESVRGGASDSREAAEKKKEKEEKNKKDQAAAALAHRIQQARSSLQTGDSPEPRAAAGRRKSQGPRQADDPDGSSRRRPISRLISGLINRAILQRLRLSRASLLFTVIFTFLVVTVLGFAAGPTALAGSLFLSLCGLSWRGLALFQSASLFVLVGLQVFAQWGHYFP